MWIENFLFLPNESRTASYFLVVTKHGVTIIVDAKHFNLDFKGTSRDVETLKNKVFDGETQVAQLTMPADCTRRFDEDTPAKLRLLKAIECSVTSRLTEYNDYANHFGGRRYPIKLTLVIANFNVDNHSVMAFVPNTGQVFDINLDIDILGKPDLGDDSFLTVPARNRNTWRELGREILKAGIVREIRLDE